MNRSKLWLREASGSCVLLSLCEALQRSKRANSRSGRECCVTFLHVVLIEKIKAKTLRLAWGWFNDSLIKNELCLWMWPFTRINLSKKIKCVVWGLFVAATELRPQNCTAHDQTFYERCHSPKVLKYATVAFFYKVYLFCFTGKSSNCACESREWNLRSSRSAHTTTRRCTLRCLGHWFSTSQSQTQVAKSTKKCFKT